MNIGMLWRNADPKTTLPAHILEAAQYYLKKYEQQPNACFLNPATLENFQDEALDLEGIQLHPVKWILPGYLWIGFDENQPDPPPPKKEAYHQLEFTIQTFT